jgi:hypothetical protein
MNLEVTGKLISFLPEITGQGKNGTWVKQDIVIEETTDKYPKKVCLTMFGDKVAMLKELEIGDELKVSFVAESREYNGKWFTNLSMWKFEKLGKQQSIKEFYKQEPADSSPNIEGSDDLPF